MTHEEWVARYMRLYQIALRIESSRRQRAKILCREAGLDDGLLGIHPHNAMCGMMSGDPWPNVDYTKVRECLGLLDRMYDGHRIVAKWDRRVRGY